MGQTIFEKSVILPVSPQQAMDWHQRPGAFERLSPPWQTVKVLARTGSIRDGDRITLQIHPLIFPMKWELEHRDYSPGKMFCDQQIQGPFKSWRHEHRFESAPGGQCTLIDRLTFEPPGGIGAGFVARQLQSLFAFRHKITRDDLSMHARHADQPRLTVAITGATGLVGRQMGAMLTTGGHRVIKLVRSGGNRPDEARWDLRIGVADPAKMQGVDAVIHLAGESVAGYWSAAKKRAIRESRVIGTQKLVESLLKLESPPRVFAGASAVGFYGGRGSQSIDESTPAGAGFLPEVCAAWEAAADPLKTAGIRVVHLRIGIVIDPRGGALAKMLTPFKLGLGGVVGGGQQYMPWITLDDVLGAFYRAILDPKMAGPHNLAAPEPLTNRQFTKALGAALRRPTIFPMPAFIVKTIFGEMGDQLLLRGVRAVPRRLLESGHIFRGVDLKSSLRLMLGKAAAEDGR